MTVFKIRDITQKNAGNFCRFSIGYNNGKFFIHAEEKEWTDTFGRSISIGNIQPKRIAQLANEILTFLGQEAKIQEWKPSYGTEQSNSWVYYKIDPKTHSKTHDRARFWWFSDHCERILTKDERSVILYAETCLVDSYGKMAQIRMNKEDLAALDRFKEEGLLDYGRLSAKEIMNVHNIIHGTHWVRFTEEAWTLAHKLRRERAARMVQ
jgi:hypothetical protein